MNCIQVYTGGGGGGGGGTSISTLSTHGLMSQVFCIYMQNGSSDCGLYAVVSIVFGEDPTTLRFHGARVNEAAPVQVPSSRKDGAISTSETTSSWWKQDKENRPTF